MGVYALTSAVYVFNLLSFFLSHSFLNYFFIFFLFITFVPFISHFFYFLIFSRSSYSSTHLFTNSSTFIPNHLPNFLPSFLLLPTLHSVFLTSLTFVTYAVTPKDLVMVNK